MQLCAMCIRHDVSYIARLRRVAGQLGSQSGDKKLVHLAIALCELALAHADDTRVMVLLAELLIRLDCELHGRSDIRGETTSRRAWE